MAGIHDAPLRRRILQGVGLVIFMTLGRLLVYREPWSVPELAIVFGSGALGGALGGATYYATDSLRAAGGWRKTCANVLTLLLYCFVVVTAVVLAAYITTGSVFGDD